jgi:hypothetical protein
MSDWSGFFMAEVGASAVLTGLIFVGVSINLTRILALPRLPSSALLALVILLTMLLVSSLLLVPGQALWLAGSETLAIGLISWLVTARLDIITLRRTDSQYRFMCLGNIALTQLAILPYIAGGALLLLQGLVGLYALVVAVVFSFAKAVLDAWVLLVEINR